MFGRPKEGRRPPKRHGVPCALFSPAGPDTRAAIIKLGLPGRMPKQLTTVQKMLGKRAATATQIHTHTHATNTFNPKVHAARSYLWNPSVRHKLNSIVVPTQEHAAIAGEDPNTKLPSSTSKTLEACVSRVAKPRGLHIICIIYRAG